MNSAETPWVVVPGNHDVPTPGTSGTFLDLFGDYPRTDIHDDLAVDLIDTMHGLPAEHRTPSERLSLTKTGWYSRGAAGSDQLQSLTNVGHQFDDPDSTPPSILCLHHHLKPSVDVLGRSFDASAPDHLMIPALDSDHIIQAASQRGTRLILHGHQHRWWPLYDVGKPERPILVSNPGSSTHGKPARRGRAFDLTPDGQVTVWEFRHTSDTL